MTQPTSFRDVEFISAYLDGQLSQADKANLETRLKNEPRLNSIMDELRQARAMLRALPARRAARNFLLTPKMAGVRPPLPRFFPIFRMASVLAAVLFFFVFAVNLSTPIQFAMRAAAPMAEFGIGGSGNPAAMEGAPAAPALAAPQADSRIAATSVPDMGMAQQAAPTQSAEMVAATETVVEPGAQAKTSPPAQSVPVPQATGMEPLQLPVPAMLQFGLLGLAVLSGGAAYFLRARTESNWFKAHAFKPSKPDIRKIVFFILLLLMIITLILGIYFISNTVFYAPAV